MLPNSNVKVILLTFIFLTVMVHDTLLASRLGDHDPHSNNVDEIF